MKTYFEWGGLAIGFIPVFHVKIGYKSGRNDVMKAYDLHVSNREIRWKRRIVICIGFSALSRSNLFR